MIEFRQISYIKTIVVLGHSNAGNPQDSLTFDCEVRTRAAGVLFSKKETSEILLLGGGNDEVQRQTEGKRMSQYLVDNFNIDENKILIDSKGTNTLSNIANIIEKVDKEGLDRNEIAFITSGYNTVRLNLVLEILGWPNAYVLSAERILMQTDDPLSKPAGDYIESLEYQNRLSYEAYWSAKTVYDEEYTKDVRNRLNISESPIEYFKKQPRREMEDFDGFKN